MDSLVDICLALGRRVPHWVQGKGGNVSVKQGSRLWIKASGAHLSGVTASRGIACVDLDRFRAQHATAPERDAETWYADTLMACAEGTARPSMETGFHAILPATWVLHVHSLAAIVMAHERHEDPAALDTFLSAHAPFPVRFTGAELPGWSLSSRLIGTGGAPAIVLENHGVILQGEEPHALIDRWTDLEEAFCGRWGCPELVAFGSRLPDAVLAGQPFRAYFPDAVVFRDAVTAVSRQPSAARAGTADQRDALEILEAIALLERARPALRELPAAQQSAIAALPTEAFRKA